MFYEMGFKGTKAEKKVLYDKKLVELLEEYTQVLICAADNVGSKQLQGIRKGLRPDSVVLMGKNTMMKRSIRIQAEKTGNKDYDALLPALVVCLCCLVYLVTWTIYTEPFLGKGEMMNYCFPIGLTAAMMAYIASNFLITLDEHSLFHFMTCR